MILHNMGDKVYDEARTRTFFFRNQFIKLDTKKLKSDSYEGYSMFQIKDRVVFGMVSKELSKGLDDHYFLIGYTSDNLETIEGLV